MCGICGRINFSPEPVQNGLVRDMNERMRHRGPDEDGYYISSLGNFSMAMRRLKIIDLSTGSQPLFNEDRNVAVMLNGEIYNYIELREDLEKRGHRFATRSDTETIAHAYEEYGLEFPSRLNGMFGLALWDDSKKILILARDRMGIKPLHYRQDERGLSFASEIKSLLADPACPKETDPRALDDYFSLLYVPGPRTIFIGIKKLDPGCFLLCEPVKKKTEIRRYWKKPLIIAPPDLGWPAYEEKLDFLLKDSLKLQLRSDVPNGLFLSSGLDSGTIAYYASLNLPGKIKSFTIYFSEESYSEAGGARAIAERCGCEHHEMELHPDARELILKTADFFDEPFADTSAIPTFLLCQFARREITVALSGEGGDELFAGYPTYIATRLARAYGKFPSLFRKTAAALVGRIPVSWERLSWEYKLKQFVSGAEGSSERSHFAWKEIFPEEEKKKLYNGSFLDAKDGHDGFESFEKLFSEAGNGIELEKLLFVDQNSYLLDQFLVKSDRMSMAHALEVRVPLLDHRIVEFASEIPAKYKLKGFTTKWTLRKLMEKKLPPEIVSGSKKGFSPPIPSWLSGPLKPFLQETLSASEIRKTGLLNENYVQFLMEEHFRKRRDNHRRLWAILNFVLWNRRWNS